MAEESTIADDLRYEDLLRRWRFAKPDDLIFADGRCWGILSQWRAKVGLDAHIRISEKVGWPNPYPVPADEDLPLPKEYEVVLTDGEISWAISVASAMHGTSVKAKSKPSIGIVEGTEYNNHIVGAIGECAWCRYFDKLWAGKKSVGVYKGPDAGKRIQIRTRSKYYYGLYLRPGEDNVNHIYFHQFFQPPRTVILRGWMHGHELKKMPLVDLERSNSKEDEKRNKKVHLADKRSSWHDIETVPRDFLNECSGPFELPEEFRDAER